VLQLPSLIVSAQRDEAGAWLQWHASVGELPFWFSRLVWGVIEKIPSIFKFYLAPLVVVHILTKLTSLDLMAAYIELAFMAFMLVLFALVVTLVGLYVLYAAIPYFAQSHRLSFGTEGALTGALVKIWVKPTPERFDASVVHLESIHFNLLQLFALNHSQYYSDVACLKLIAQWLSQNSSANAPVDHHDHKESTSAEFNLTPLALFFVAWGFIFFWMLSH
jgi:hypothetical protein